MRTMIGPSTTMIVIVWLAMILFAILLFLYGCAYGEGYWLFPQDKNGYHFDPCLHMDKVRPENRRQYEIECP